MAELAHPADRPTVTVKDGRTFVSIPSRVQAENILHTTRRKLADLPDIPDRANPISAVVAYDLFGLDAEDIAAVTGLSPGQVSSIMVSEAYSQMRAAVIANVQAAAQDQVTSVFKSKAAHAAHRITEHIDSARADVSLRAAKEALSFAGYGPREASGQDIMRAGLNIVVYNDKAEPKVVVP